MSQTERLYWIDDQIRSRRYPNALAVHAHFGVSIRTAYADRNYLLERLHAPLVCNRERGGWEYTSDTYLLPFLALSGPEAAALRRSFLAAREYLGPDDAEPVRLLFERLAPYVPRRPDLESVGGSIRLTESAGETEVLLSDCRRAVRNRHRLQLRYYSAHRGEENERVIQPYHLHNFRGEHHVIAWCEWRQEFRQFLLGRIRQAQVLEPEAAFVRDPSFNVDAYLAKGLGVHHGEPLTIVRVRFSAYQARWIRERHYHNSQQIEEQPDGSLVVTLCVAGTEEIKRWVLGYGAHAEVLEPTTLRAQIGQELKKLVKIYDE